MTFVTFFKYLIGKAFQSDESYQNNTLTAYTFVSAEYLQKVFMVNILKITLSICLMLKTVAQVNESELYEKQESKKAKRLHLRYFNFEPSFKVRWCHAQDLFGSQIPVTLWPYGLVGQVSTSYARYSQFKPSGGHWNL